MEKQWYHKQLRMVQTVMREIDIKNYDAKGVVEYLKSVHANVIIVNAGGVVDFFDNETELNRPNRFRTNENVLGDLTRECHAAGIRVMVRVDFRGVEQERYERAPHWFGQNKDGSAQMGWTRIYRPCYNSVYPNRHAVEFIRQMMEKYPIDGVWENSVGFGMGPCYCPTCRENYRLATGKEIPTGDNYAAPEFDDYRAWKAGCADAHIRLLRDTVKSFGEDKAFCSEIFGMFHAGNALQTGIDLYNAKDHFDFLVSPAFLTGAGTLGMPYDNLTQAASSIRFLKSIQPQKQAVLLYGNNGTKWRYVKDPAIENKLWMWEAAAVGGGYWNCLFNGQHPGATHDIRAARMEEEVYKYLLDNEEILEGKLPVKDVGILYVKAARDTFGKDDETKDGYGIFIKGLERVLTENHVQYSFIPDLDLKAEDLAGLKALLVPNAACLSDEQAALIRDYVKNGGGLIAGFETSLYDENAKRRNDFALADVFGVHFTGMRRDTSFDCYQLINAPEHPVLAKIDTEHTQMLINGGETLLVTAAENGAQAVASYIPRIENQPPEHAWIPDHVTPFPTVAANIYGAGKVVYFANQVEKLCHMNGHDDYFDLYMGALEYVLSDALTLTADAPHGVHAALMEDPAKPGDYVLSMVNTCGAQRRPIREVVPVYDLRIRLSGCTLASLENMLHAEGFTAENTDDGVEIRIPKLEMFAAARVTVCKKA